MSYSSSPVCRSVAGIALRKARVLVGRRKPGGALGGKWEFPGGKREPGESDEDALIREYDEEFGVAVAVGAFLGESQFVNGDKRYGLAALLVELQAEPAELREHDELRWVDAVGLVALDLAESDRALLPFVLPLLA
ncbi:MAG TPA: CTP pyrophosphohydrolase [Spirochaetaceae bacterium]|nr:CTP pyrophosphohydrolase [Spirochaetaceae bacterium]